ncbi:MAG: NUDIX domain-containing protein [Polyangiales bacterium]
MAGKRRASSRERPRKLKPVDTEEAFLGAYDAKAFEQVSVAVDVALLSVADGAMRVRLVQRTEHPARGKWAIPGGFVRPTESLDAAAARVLHDKAGVAGVFLEQLYTFGDPRRDPRTRVLSVAYYALVASGGSSVEKGPTEMGKILVPWEGETGGEVEVTDAAGKPMALAFDHASILGMAIKRVRGKLDYTPIGFQLLPARFTLRMLQDVHETVLGRPLNKDSFRRRMLASELLEATGEHEDDAPHRPAELYRFTRRSAV